MTKTKKVSKNSLEYILPPLASFSLQAFPGVTFTFQKASLDHIAWCQAKFGKEPAELISQQKATVWELCQLYFHYLDDASKAHFKPEMAKTMDYDTGLEKEEMVTGPKKFMKSIQGGHIEFLIIADAFGRTLLASRPISDLPEELKKSLQQMAQKPKDESPSL